VVGRLVQEQQFRLAGEGAADGDAATLAAGQRGAGAGGILEAERVEQRLGARFDLRASRRAFLERGRAL
jgi:hypothetical protein